MRTFIAIDLNNRIKENLISLIDILRNKGGNIKWIEHQGMHITLKFLGEIEENKISEIEEILKTTTRDLRPFSLKVKGTGHFPNGRNPRILWAGIEADKILSSFHHQLEGELEGIGFPREKRSFHPHLTLGRVRSTSFVRDTIAEFYIYREKFFGEMMVKKITFFRSILKPSGAEYSVLYEHPLK